MEIDRVAESKCGRVVLVEVKKTQAKTGLNTVEDFQEKVEAYRRLFPKKTILPAVLSLGGFTKEAKPFCDAQCLAIAEQIEHY